MITPLSSHILIILLLLLRAQGVSPNPGLTFLLHTRSRCTGWLKDADHGANIPLVYVCGFKFLTRKFLTLETFNTPKISVVFLKKNLPMILSPRPPQQLVRKKKTTLSTPHRFRAPRLGVWHPPSWSRFNDLLLLTFIATTAQRDLVNQETEAAAVSRVRSVYMLIYTHYRCVYIYICTRLYT